MKGIAITLATRDDGEAIDRIEKLIGHEIPKTGPVAAEADGEPDGEAKPQRRRTTQKQPPQTASPPAKACPAPKADPTPTEGKRRKPTAETQQSRKEPVVEDIAEEWNGPFPSFLSVGAGTD